MRRLEIEIYQVYEHMFLKLLAQARQAQYHNIANPFFQNKMLPKSGFEMSDAFLLYSSGTLVLGVPTKTRLESRLCNKEVYTAFDVCCCFVAGL